MIKTIWATLIIGGVIFGAMAGKAASLGEIMLGGAAGGVELVFSMLGAYCLFLGLLRIAERSGLIDAVSRLTRPLVCALFRGLSRGSEATSLITLNLVANMLGMGNAATPFGLAAMRALQAENAPSMLPSDDMCLFLIVNTASVQLLPLSIIAVRAAAGAQHPSDIVLSSFLATLATAIMGVLLARLFARAKPPCRR